LALGQKGVGFLAGAVLLAILLLFMKMEKSCVTIQSMGSPPCEQVWEQTRKSYEAYIGLLREKEIERSSKIAAWNGKTAYDMYEPEWVCDSEKRVGPGEINFGDGPKFVCGPDLLRDHLNPFLYMTSMLIRRNLKFYRKYLGGSYCHFLVVHTPFQATSYDQE